MQKNTTRQSWDTSVNHLARIGLLKDVLSREQLQQIPSSNISRWKQEDESKYRYSEINDRIQNELDLIKKINQSSNIKKINESYFRLADTFHEATSQIKGIKPVLKQHKELLSTLLNH